MVRTAAPCWLRSSGLPADRRSMVDAGNRVGKFFFFYLDEWECSKNLKTKKKCECNIKGESDKTVTTYRKCKKLKSIFFLT
ncbi:hypothetical protein Y032_0017g3354 [Ancylostoma ceylanicum]|uniref:Uncharacterized protein n=1 Tax=Ancylostoma ceylanicum TaxID=53326 RepID=A0A016V442_9BILA|nr:hypothetical protein Y032_0017g3354 [Ancylostoma ceylanicum]